MHLLRALAALVALACPGCTTTFTFGEAPPAPAAAAAAPPAAVLFVDLAGAETADGSAARPFRTLGAAVAAAGAGPCEIRVAPGRYVENVRVEAAALHVVGGVGGETRLVAAREGAVITLIDPRGVVLEGLAVEGGTGAFDGDRWEGGGVHVEGGSARLTRMLVERNDIRHGETMARGGGVSVEQAELVIEDSVLRANRAMRGAALSAGHVESLVVRRTRVESNVGSDDHGGGLFLEGARILLEDDVIRGNVIGRTDGVRTWGWGGGVYLHGHGTQAWLRGNVLTENSAPSLGSGLFVDNEATAYLSHELYFRNACNSGGVAVYVDGLDDTLEHGSRAFVDSSTIADHACVTEEGGNAVLAQGGSRVEVTNSIVWGNGTRAAFWEGAPLYEVVADFVADATSDVAVAYTLARAPVVLRKLEGDRWEETPLLGAGNLFEDPVFVDPARGDFHLASRRGRWSTTANAGRGGWVRDEADSPAIDRADPAADALAEPAGSARRRDLGRYGGTREASLAEEAP